MESVILTADGEIRRLNLKDPAVRERAKRVRTSADVLSLFADAAVSLPTG